MLLPERAPRGQRISLDHDALRPIEQPAEGDGLDAHRHHLGEWDRDALALHGQVPVLAVEDAAELGAAHVGLEGGVALQQPAELVLPRRRDRRHEREERNALGVHQHVLQLVHQPLGRARRQHDRRRALVAHLLATRRSRRIGGTL
eukprot:6378925-Prymnesium_polylepis.1